MANIIIPKPDSFGKTRSEHEVQLRKEWGKTMTDSQLDRLKFMEKKHKDKTGSSKNFIACTDIDKMSSVLHCDHSTGNIFGAGYSKQGEINYANINWS